MPPVERHSRLHGFSLLEVLVAFTILAMSLAVLFRIFSGGLYNLRISEGYSQAVLLAQSRLTELGLSEPLETGITQGEWGEDFVWQQTVEPFYPWAEEQDLSKPITAYQVTVEVSWTDRGKQRQIVLSTVRLKAQPVFGGVDGSRG